MKVLLAPAGFESVLADELRGQQVLGQRGRLFICDDSVRANWTQNVWTDAQTFKFESISQAASHLRALQRNWWLHGTGHFRRAALIRDKLPSFRPKPIQFPSPLPSSPLGSWTLLDEGTLLFAAKCTSPFADGEAHFVENKVEPPSRAYLKLWELFSLEEKYPRPGERVIDLGSSPGGWTWVLDQLGARTISVDKVELSTHLNLSPRVEFRRENAFSLDPSAIGAVEWMFSDVICYPGALLELIGKWRSVARNMVCTIKFQGSTDHGIVEKFLEIPGSKVRHLSHNKHELTWYRVV